MEQIKTEKPLVQLKQSEEKSLTCGEYCAKTYDYLNQVRLDIGIPDYEYSTMIALAGISVDKLKKADFSRAENRVSSRLGINRRNFDGFGGFVKELLIQRKIFDYLKARDQQV